MRKNTLAVASHASSVSSDVRLTEAQAISALAALAQSTRLAIFKLLIKHEPVGITAGVIAETIGAPHNTLSTHLAILVRAGLLRAAREGRTIIYRSNVEGMQSLLHFVVNDCCDGHPELCNFLGETAAACCAAAAAPAKTSKTKPASRKRPARQVA
jgi:DNA-binding transcriptional ArsR family regulator